MKKTMLLEVIGSTVENRTVDFLIEGIGIGYTKKTSLTTAAYSGRPCTKTSRSL